VAANTYYYVYAVPATTGWRKLSFVASATDPDAGGPASYPFNKYIGFVLTGDTSYVIPFVQNGCEFMIHEPWFYCNSRSGAPSGLDLAYWFTKTGTTVNTDPQVHYSSTWYSLMGGQDLITYGAAPKTFSKILLCVTIRGSLLHASNSDAKIGIVTWPVDPPTGNFQAGWPSRDVFFCQGATTCTQQLWLPRTDNNKVWWYNATGPYTNQFMAIGVRGWMDKWLPGNE
jgi:hypothetical protein